MSRIRSKDIDHRQPATSRNRLLRRSAGVSALALAVAAVLLSPAGAAQTFSDDAGVHQPSVDALAAAGVFAGTECEDGRFCPGQPIKRWTMAVWLVRVLEGRDPDPIGSSRFSDVADGVWWAPYVERLAELELTGGCSIEPLRYCPGATVSRAQMASFLVGAFDLETDVADAGFGDVGEGGHSPNINAIAAAGITAGCRIDPLLYCPFRPVTRGQMASFLNQARTRPNFTAVTAGSEHSCGLRSNGALVCWGENTLGQSEPPRGAFDAITAASTFSEDNLLDLPLAAPSAQNRT